jgi:transcriptional regulator with XRE-family HTH domain
MAPTYHHFSEDDKQASGEEGITSVIGPDPDWGNKVRDVPHSPTTTPGFNPVGDNSRALRAARGWTLAEVEERSGVRANLLSMMESGKRPNPTLETILALAAVYAVPVEVLVTPPGETPPTMPAGLQALIDSKIEGAMTAEEIRRLLLAVSPLGVDLSATDYAVMLRWLRERPRPTHG